MRLEGKEHSSVKWNTSSPATVLSESELYISRNKAKALFCMVQAAPTVQVKLDERVHAHQPDVCSAFIIEDI